jgi:mRNA interferase MazF
MLTIQTLQPRVCINHLRLHHLVTVSTVIIQRELGELPSDIQAQMTEKLCHLLTE